MQERLTIELGKDKILTLDIKDFGNEAVDIEDLLQVDLNSIMADICTFPVIFNRIATIKADIDSLLRETIFDFHVFEAQLYETHKKAIAGSGEKATEKGVEMAIQRDPKYKAKKYEVFRVQKQADIIDGLYWSAKSKDKKLDAISTKIKPEEFEKEILEGVVNSVMIRTHKNLFPNKR